MGIHALLQCMPADTSMEPQATRWSGEQAINGKFQWQVIDASMLSLGMLVILGRLIMLPTLPAR